MTVFVAQTFPFLSLAAGRCLSYRGDSGYFFYGARLSSFLMGVNHRG